MMDIDLTIDVSDFDPVSVSKNGEKTIVISMNYEIGIVFSITKATELKDKLAELIAGIEASSS